MNSITFRLLGAVIFLFCSSFSSAERAWVIGSFGDPSRAQTAAESLTGQTGLEVWVQSAKVGESQRYRLVVFPLTVQQDPIVFREQLIAAGIEGPWELSLSRESPNLQSTAGGQSSTVDLVMQGDDSRVRSDDDLQVDVDLTLYADGDFEDDFDTSMFSETTGDFLVVASFDRAEPAYELQRKLMDDFPEVLVREASKGVNYYHRVLVGPLESTDNIYGRLAELGFNEPWPLRDVNYLPVNLDTSALVIPDETRQRTQPTARRYSPPPDPTLIDTGGYNPARLEGRYEVERPTKKGWFWW